MDLASLIVQWRQFAVANRHHAFLREVEGDLFGAELSRARAEVRQAAANILRDRTADPMTAAREMHVRATELWQYTLPFIGFDEAAIKYTRSRTWQDCARAVDPSLPIVQPKLTSE